MGCLLGHISLPEKWHALGNWSAGNWVLGERKRSDCEVKANRRGPAPSSERLSELLHASAISDPGPDCIVTSGKGEQHMEPELWMCFCLSEVKRSQALGPEHRPCSSSELLTITSMCPDAREKIILVYTAREIFLIMSQRQ